MLFIDTSTGTWGNAEDIVLVSDEWADELEDNSDSEIIDKGDQWGRRLPIYLLLDSDGLY